MARRFKFIGMFLGLQLTLMALFVFLGPAGHAQGADSAQQHQAFALAMVHYHPLIISISYLTASLFAFGLGWRSLVNLVLAGLFFFAMSTPEGQAALRKRYHVTDTALSTSAPESADESSSYSSTAPGATPIQLTPVTPPTVAPPPHYRYFLKQPVTVKNAYGAVNLPANTEVQVLKQTGATTHASAQGMEFDVAADQITRVRQ